MAHAATEDIVVTNLALSGAGSFRAALEQANASTNPDGVNISFASALTGTGALTLDVTTEVMSTTPLNLGSQNLAAGAWFVVDNAADAPVSIDFANLDGISTEGWGADSPYAGFAVESDNVSLSNLANLRVGESGIAIRGTGTSISNVQVKDPDSWNMEVGVLLMDGATDTTLTDVTVHSPYWGSVVVDNNATVTNTVITGLESRGVENYGHVMFEDNAVANGFQVHDSVLGAPAEVAPGQGFYFNPGVTTTGLEVTGTTFQSPNETGVFFLFGGQTLTDTVFTGNTFGSDVDHRIADVIGGNTATWDNLTFDDNTVVAAGSILMGSVLNNATFTGNTFTDVFNYWAPALQLDGASSDVTVSANTFTRTEARDAIRVQGTSADNVKIEGNTLTNTWGDVAWSAIDIKAKGTGNTVSGNTLTQDIADASLPANLDDQWAIYVDANASAADQPVGWSITNNAIDGFGGKDRSEAPIKFVGTGKLPVTGNTFGVNTRGSVAVETEEGPAWFLWNVWNSASNNSVQTFRAEKVVYTGSNVRFTAVQPDPVIGNNPAVGPVTLHVYWTAADNAEEYLGEITDVTAGSVVSLPSTHTDGVIRVQTVDANGYTSQYSSIDPQAPVVLPAAPVVTEVAEETANGTGTPDASIVIRDEDGKTVTEAVVGADGTWTVGGLECGTTYTVVQVVDGLESETTEFTTAECAVAPTAPVVTETTQDGASGTGTPDAGVIVRDEDGKTVTEAVVGADGTWTVGGLECGTTYTVVQVVDGLESETTELTTADCPVEPEVPAAPVVTDNTDDGVSGTGTPGGTVVIRDEDSNTVTTVVIDENGNWVVDGGELECGTDYSIVQIVDGVSSEPIKITTAECSVVPAVPTAPVVTDNDGDGISGTGTPGGTVVVNDEGGKEVTTVVIDQNGNWVVPGAALSCGTDYTVIQVVDGVKSEPTAVTTPACATPIPTKSVPAGGKLPTTGAELSTGTLFGGAALLAIGGAVFLIARKRSRA